VVGVDATNSVTGNFGREKVVEGLDFGEEGGGAERDT
jgi:hypothetical protein